MLIAAARELKADCMIMDMLRRQVAIPMASVARTLSDKLFDCLYENMNIMTNLLDYEVSPFESFFVFYITGMTGIGLRDIENLADEDYVFLLALVGTMSKNFPNTVDRNLTLYSEIAIDDDARLSIISMALGEECPKELIESGVPSTVRKMLALLKKADYRIMKQKQGE